MQGFEKRVLPGEETTNAMMWGRNKVCDEQRRPMSLEQGEGQQVKIMSQREAAPPWSE